MLQNFIINCFIVIEVDKKELQIIKTLFKIVIEFVNLLILINKIFYKSYMSFLYKKLIFDKENY